jgi:hypothetical protein
MDEATNETYLRVQSGVIEVVSPRIMAAKLCDPGTRDIFQSMAPKIIENLELDVSGAGPVRSENDA